MPLAAGVDSDQPGPSSRGPCRKPFSSCDSCKLRRVKCDSVAPPGSCSRCISKGIKCTTQKKAASRGKRKERSGRRIEEAKAMYGELNEFATSPAASVRAEVSIVENELTGELTAHLLYLYETMPRANMFPCTFVFSAFETAGRRLSNLPPSTQTLVLAVAATTARISSHPALLGPGGPPAEELTKFFFDPMRFVDAGPSSDDGSAPTDESSLPYSVGSRRENACERLREKALDHAWARRISTPGVPSFASLHTQTSSSPSDSGARDDGEEALATCFLLRFLEHPTYCELHDVQWRPDRASERDVWSSAFVSHLRQQRMNNASTSGLSTGSPKEGQASRSSTLRWSVHIMREAVTCAAYDNACQYTLQDEVMLAGPPPPLPEEVLAEANTPDGGQWWDTQMFYTLVRPYTYGMTQVAFNSFDWSARRRASLPFSLPRLRAHMAALKTLHTLLALAHTRFAVAFGAEATSIRLSARASFGGLHTRHGTASANAKAQHRQDNAREAEQADRDAARAVLGAMESAMAHVNIPIWVDVEARLAAATAADQEGDDVVMLRKVMNGLRRALLPYVVRMLGQGAGVGDGGFVESNVSLAALTQLGDEPAKFWTWVILSSIPVENGGEGITRAQKLHTLESVYKIYKVISWAWPRVLKTDTAIRVKTALEMLRLEHMFDEIYGPTSCGVSDPMTGASTPDTESDQAGSHSSSSPSASGSSGSSQWHTSESASSILDLPDVEAVLRSTGILDEPLTPSRRSPIFMNTRNNLSLRGAGSEVAGFLTSGLTSTPMDLPMTDPGGVSLDLMTPYLTKNAVQVPSMLTVTLPETCQDRSNLSYDAHGAALEQLRGTMQALE